MRGALYVAIVATAGVAAVLVACNAILGINEATTPDAGSADAGSDVMVPSLVRIDCKTYCNEMDLSCGSPNLEYKSSTISGQFDGGSVCESICNTRWGGADELNQPVDLTGPKPTDDSLGCRIWHAYAAKRTGMPAEHCPHAGPLGGGVCGMEASEACAEFCTLAMKYCGPSVYDGSYYDGSADCINACLPDAGYPGFKYIIDQAVVGSGTPPNGNTLNCRMYHLENALALSVAEHCPHTSQSGGGVCVDQDN
jgi:hypothetical protein